MGHPSPAETHQVIHVRGSGGPYPIPNFPSKAKAPAAPASAPGTRGNRAWVRWPGFPSGAPATPASAPRLLALGEQRLAFLRCLSPARPQRSQPGTPLPSPEKRQGQIRRAWGLQVRGARAAGAGSPPGKRDSGEKHRAAAASYGA